jgi:hypothetical protein
MLQSFSMGTMSGRPLGRGFVAKGVTRLFEAAAFALASPGAGAAEAAAVAWPDAMGEAVSVGLAAD